MMEQGTVSVPPIGLTAKYPELGTGPCSADIYWREDLWRKEIDAIFRKSWFMIGRIDQIPEPGDFFTYELPVFRQALLIVRGKDGVVRGFHNVCTHRGNVVEHRPSGSGSGRFMCRFHGWIYDSKGELTRIRDEEGFFNLDKQCLGLKPVPLGVWEGFIFVSPEEEPSQSLEDYLGEQGKSLEGYPWSACTQSVQYEVEIQCNWKLVVDSFAEIYHIPTLHPRTAAPTVCGKFNPMGRLLDVELKGNHRTNSHWSDVPEVTNPVQILAYQNAAGQNHLGGDNDFTFPPGLNHLRAPNWTVDLCIFFPALSFTVASRVYTAHQVWPLAPNRCLYQQRVFMRPAQNAAERFGQENSMVEYRDISLEDLSTLERIQRSLDTGVIKEFHFHDHELALRHQHHVITQILADYDRDQGLAE
jgi:phenylpropionate dioxygenase-like ring-hydroxylating dioxygenase large terminal subunit